MNHPKTNLGTLLVIPESIRPHGLDAAVADRMAAARSAWDFWLDIGSREDISAEAGRLDMPILVVTGDQDEHLGPAAADQHVTPHLAHATHRVIAGSGHLIPYEAPAALAAEILAWRFDDAAAGDPANGSTSEHIRLSQS